MSKNINLHWRAMVHGRRGSDGWRRGMVERMNICKSLGISLFTARHKEIAEEHEGAIAEFLEDEAREAEPVIEAILEGDRSAYRSRWGDDTPPKITWRTPPMATAEGKVTSRRDPEVLIRAAMYGDKSACHDLANIIFLMGHTVLIHLEKEIRDEAIVAAQMQLLTVSDDMLGTFAFGLWFYDLSQVGAFTHWLATILKNKATDILRRHSIEHKPARKRAQKPAAVYMERGVPVLVYPYYGPRAEQWRPKLPTVEYREDHVPGTDASEHEALTYEQQGHAEDGAPIVAHAERDDPSLLLEAKQLVAALEAFTDREREVMLARAYGNSMAEIAEQIILAESSVRRIIAEARVKARRAAKGEALESE